MVTILIVEDNRSLVEIFARVIEQQGYKTICAVTCNAAKEKLSTQKIDVAIIDINLSGLDRARDRNLSTGTSLRISSENICVDGEEGFHLVAWMRHHHPEIGSIILTDRTDIEDQVLGRDLGADDYAIKPIQPNDLQARVRSLLRRLGSEKVRTIVFGNWEFDTEKLSLNKIGFMEVAIRVEVSESELKALKLLTNRLGSIISRSTLCNFIHGRPLAIKDRSIDNIISKLRGKLDEGMPSGSSHITTVHGAGYRLEPFVAGRR